MKATHLLHGQYPVKVEEGSGTGLVKITYVGPNVPGNRKLGETRYASPNGIDGKPQLTPLSR